MIIAPKIRGFVCTTAHPAGCERHISELIDISQHQSTISETSSPPKNVLIIGGSSGYGLATRVLCAAGYGSHTLSVSLEKPPRPNKPASAGWYNSYYFERWAEHQGTTAKTITGDAFLPETKQQVIEYIRKHMGKIDLVVYSLAAPRRAIVTSSSDTQLHQSVIKPIDQDLSGLTIDTASGELKPFDLKRANATEIEETISVMGGDDWFQWVKTLSEHQLLAEQAKTVAFSYLGGALTRAIYGDGTLGAAKKDLESYCQRINQELLPTQGPPNASIAVLKAVVTQSSAAIPSLPLYVSLLYRVMKQAGTHEGCMEQIIRLFATGLYPCSDKPCLRDKPFRFRLDDLELTAETQRAVSKSWQEVMSGETSNLGDVEGYRTDYLKLFGFAWPEINYDAPVEIQPLR